MKSEHFVAIGRLLKERRKITQRELAAGSKLSLGLVNSVIKESVQRGYLEQKSGREIAFTAEGEACLENFRVKNAIILAAGFGSRCVPLTYETPKGLLEVYGQPMIERQIEQLLEKGISEIIVVVGYKKERFDYLTDKYGVKLVYNAEYAVKNNLSSLHCVLPYLDNTYLLMSDHRIERNIFKTYEAHSWYSCIYADGETDEWCVEVSKTGKIKSLSIGGRDAWTIVGPAYFSRSFSKLFKQYVAEYYSRPASADYYWEHVLMDRIDVLPIYMNDQDGNVQEIENLEELRALDPSYNITSNSKILKVIADFFDASESEITNIRPIKIGMTNRSFTFVYRDSRYIMRVPGEGSSMLINRRQEYAVYQIVAPLGISDELVYFDPENGYKITRYIENARVCNPLDFAEVKICMSLLRAFHNRQLSVEHTFDPFERIEYYESLWLREISCFRDYEDTKANIMGLKTFVESEQEQWTLTHIDAVPDNFLFEEQGGEPMLIDWEYAAMQDPHLDIAMFAVYSMYDTRQQVDTLINCYFDEGCTDAARLKIYAYIAVCGLLWSNWCEYKSDMGVEFGEYSLRQYRFAKDYYRIFNEQSR